MLFILHEIFLSKISDSRIWQLLYIDIYVYVYSTCTVYVCANVQETKVLYIAGLIKISTFIFLNGCLYVYDIYRDRQCKCDVICKIH